MPIKQLLFDCDNTLVNSEEAAFTASASTVNAILTRHNIDHTYTSDQLVFEFIGQNLRGILTCLQSKHNFTISADEMTKILQDEEEAVMKHLSETASACEDSLYTLYRITSSTDYRVAVVSSSAIGRITTCLNTAGFANTFDTVNHTNVFSAASSLPVPSSKPDPAVYLYAMKKLGVKPEECVAVEDSMSGALAAVRAGVGACIAYVGAYRGTVKQMEVADTLMGVGCKAVLWHWRDFEVVLGEVLVSIGEGRGGMNGNRVNGTGVNGTGVNGTGVNGTGVNGTGVNGTGVNGTGVNGTGVNGTGVNGTGVNGTGVNGTGVNGTGVNGIETSGYDTEEEDMEVYFSSRQPGTH